MYSIHIVLGHLTYKNGNSEIYIDCRALYKVQIKHINESPVMEIADKQQVNNGIYELYDKVKITKLKLIESNRSIKQKIQILCMNNVNTSELQNRYIQQEKIISEIHINPVKIQEKFKNESKRKTNRSNYYTKFKEVPSEYMRFYRG